MILVNKKPIEFTVFPNGETKVNHHSIIDAVGFEEGNIEISFKYESDMDLVHLLFVKSYLDETMKIPVSLVIYYMPYSRMDRAQGLSAFTLKYVTNLINALQFKTVYVLEPHSDVTTSLIDRVIARYPTFNILREAQKEIGFDSEKDYMFYPDAGAQKRYQIQGQKHLVGYKHRNFETGKIESFQVVGETPSEPFKAVIIDDLSSYGGTFMASAKELRALGATEIYLVVAHAENSILEGSIFKTDLINKVYCTNSIIDLDKANDRLAIYDVEVL